jgi:peptidoglycan hydrolase FlgJ
MMTVTPLANSRHPGLDPGSRLLSQQSGTPDQVRGDGANSEAGLRTAAQGFEQIFLRQMIGAMRAGSLGDPLFGSAGEDQFRELFDARMAESLSAQGEGLGIGELLMAQLEGGRRA